ncbi:hypothetical protein JCM3770_007426 [Rhodotorula araucariae]
MVRRLCENDPSILTGVSVEHASSHRHAVDGAHSTTTYQSEDGEGISSPKMARPVNFPVAKPHSALRLANLPNETINATLSSLIATPGTTNKERVARNKALSRTALVCKLWRNAVLDRRVTRLFLRGLVFREVQQEHRWTPFVVSANQRARSVGREVEWVTLEGIHGLGSECPARVLRAFPHVQILTLIGSSICHTWSNEGSATLGILELVKWSVADAMGSFPSLKRIAIKQSYGQELPLCFNQGTVPSLETLTLDLNPAGGDTLTYAYVSTHRPAPPVKALAVQSQVVYPYIHPLLASTNLQHLHLSVPIQSLPALLAGVKTHLSTLTISASPWTADADLVANKVAADVAFIELLSSPCLKNIEEFILIGTHAESAVNSWYKRLLAHMEAMRDVRRSLRVSTLPDDAYDALYWYPESGQHAVAPCISAHAQPRSPRLLDVDEDL